MMMKGPIRDYYPVGPQEIRLRLPAGLQPRAVALLAAERAPEHRFADGILTVQVPTIVDHEVIAVEV